MALSILDGNQSATTLSTILSSGQHITAHTVVSLGTQAITDMRSAVSGSVVSISNLPSTQTIAGTVTVGQIQGYKHASTATNGPFNADVMLVGEDIEASYAAGLVVIPAARGGGVLGGRSGQGDTPICVYGDNGSAVTISGTVTVGNTVTIAGTVTANPTGTQTIAGTVTVGQIQGYQHGSAGTTGPFNADVMLVGEDIEAAYAAGLVVIPAARGGGVLGGRTGQGDTPICVYGDNGSAVTISGTVTIGSALPAGTAQIGSVTASISNSVTIASLPAISGTVTANSSNGSLTTRFGSVTTANTAFATSAVTNANRKYLLIQNVTTASNVITVGIGFTPTTTQGIQLSSGAGLTFEGSYIPTGAVNLLSSVTASCFTILEA